MLQKLWKGKHLFSSEIVSKWDCRSDQMVWIVFLRQNFPSLHLLPFLSFFLRIFKQITDILNKIFHHSPYYLFRIFFFKPLNKNKNICYRTFYFLHQHFPFLYCLSFQFWSPCFLFNISISFFLNEFLLLIFSSSEFPITSLIAFLVNAGEDKKQLTG